MPKNDKLFTFAKTQVDKKAVVLQTPPLDPKIGVFFTLHFFKRKTLISNKKTKLKIRKKSKDKERGFERKKKRGNQPK